MGSLCFSICPLHLRVFAVACRRDEPVFQSGDAVMDVGRLIGFVVQFKFLNDAFYQRACIRFVVDGEIGLVAESHAFPSQDVRKDAVERSHVQIACLFHAYQRSDALFHLVGSLIGECEGKDIPWFQVGVAQQIGYLVGQYTRLARAGTSNNQ